MCVSCKSETRTETHWANSSSESTKDLCVWKTQNSLDKNLFLMKEKVSMHLTQKSVDCGRGRALVIAAWHTLCITLYYNLQIPAGISRSGCYPVNILTQIKENHHRHFNKQLKAQDWGLVISPRNFGRNIFVAVKCGDSSLVDVQSTLVAFRMVEKISTATRTNGPMKQCLARAEEEEMTDADAQSKWLIISTGEWTPGEFKLTAVSKMQWVGWKPGNVVLVIFAVNLEWSWMT